MSWTHEQKNGGFDQKEETEKWMLAMPPTVCAAKNLQLFHISRYQIKTVEPYPILMELTDIHYALYFVIK